MTNEIEKTEQLIRGAQELKEKFQKRPPSTSISFHAAVGLDERHQWAPLLERQIPHFLPT